MCVCMCMWISFTKADLMKVTLLCNCTIFTFFKCWFLHLGISLRVTWNLILHPFAIDVNAPENIFSWEYAHNELRNRRNIWGCTLYISRKPTTAVKYDIFLVKYTLQWRWWKWLLFLWKFEVSLTLIYFVIILLRRRRMAI